MRWWIEGLMLCLLMVTEVVGQCRYRNLDLPQDVFQYWASWGCYIYTRPDFFDKQPIRASMCSLFLDDVVYNVPGIQQDSFCQPFHHTNQWVVAEVDGSFWSNRSVSRWIECTEEAEECCANVMANEDDVDDRCPSVWDGWSCFRSIPANRNYQIICPRFAYGYEPPRCHHFGYKRCFANATWNDQTDYSPCDVTPPLLARNRYYIAVLVISTIFCIPALLVLFLAKIAPSQKLRIIRTLLLVICIHNVLMILVRAVMIIPELTTVKPTTTIMYKNGVACRCLTTLEKLLGNGVFCCMLLIGILLFQLLNNPFRIHDRTNGVVMYPFYLGAVVIALASAGSWAVMMYLNYDHNCWQVTSDSYVDWILDGPRLVMLCVNLFLLLHVTIRLWHAFNAKESDVNPFLRALKAALICLPVFGMQFLFLIIRPDMDNCGTEQFYYIVSYTIVGAQGIFIAIFHCYTERDVSKHFVEWWRKLRGICRKKRLLSRQSTRTETHQEVVGSVTLLRREQKKNRPRSISLPDRLRRTQESQV